MEDGIDVDSDMNSMVDDILQKKEVKTRKKTNIPSKSKRMSADQRAVLLEEFEKCPNWDSRLMTQLSRKLKLAKAKVYKWNWDHKLTIKRRAERE